MTSPTASAPSHSNTNTNKKCQFVDLTLEENDSQNINITPKNYTYKRTNQNQGNAKNQKRRQRSKLVHWNDKEDIKNYHPRHPATSPFTPWATYNFSGSQTTRNIPAPGVPYNTVVPGNGHHTSANTIFFQQAPPPPPPPHHILQMPGTFLTYPTTSINTFPYQINPNPYQNQSLPGVTGNPFGNTTPTTNNSPKRVTLSVHSPCLLKNTKDAKYTNLSGTKTKNVFQKAITMKKKTVCQNKAYIARRKHP